MTEDNEKNLNKEYKSNEEVLSLEDKISYELILGFRKTKGINMDEFFKKYNKDIKDLINEDKLVIKDNYIFINEKYLYIENEILSNFI